MHIHNRDSATVIHAVITQYRVKYMGTRAKHETGPRDATHSAGHRGSVQDRRLRLCGATSRQGGSAAGAGGDAWRGCRALACGAEGVGAQRAQAAEGAIGVALQCSVKGGLVIAKT